jgi:hypothetical protein
MPCQCLLAAEVRQRGMSDRKTSRPIGKALRNDHQSVFKPLQSDKNQGLGQSTANVHRLALTRLG